MNAFCVGLVLVLALPPDTKSIQMVRPQYTPLSEKEDSRSLLPMLPHIPMPAAQAESKPAKVAPLSDLETWVASSEFLSDRNGILARVSYLPYLAWMNQRGQIKIDRLGVFSRFDVLFSGHLGSDPSFYVDQWQILDELRARRMESRMIVTRKRDAKTPTWDGHIPATVVEPLIWHFDPDCVFDTTRLMAIWLLATQVIEYPAFMKHIRADRRTFSDFLMEPSLPPPAQMWRWGSSTFP